jgi:allophanate hydrolase subunit 1
MFGITGCSQNMLYPREDPAAKESRDNRRLVYVCRNCGHQENGIDESIPVYRNVLVHSAEYAVDYQSPQARLYHVTYMSLS